MDNTILMAVVGSKAYGMDHAKSDTDTLGVFVPPTTKIAGLDWHSSKETTTNAGPSGDDSTSHEVGKFCRLALKGNPTVLELLFVGDYMELTEEGSQLLSIREDFLSYSTVRGAYYGYAKSQLDRLQREANSDKFKPKMARHALRLARQGNELLSTGAITVRVADPQEYFDLTDLPFEDMLDKIDKEVSQILTIPSVLRGVPRRQAVSDFLDDVRRNNIG